MADIIKNLAATQNRSQDVVTAWKSFELYLIGERYSQVFIDNQRKNTEQIPTNQD